MNSYFDYLDSKLSNPSSPIKGLGSSAHGSHISNAKELYRQASVDWSEKLTESHKDEFRQLAHQNKEVIHNWYKAHHGSNLLDDLGAMEKDITDMKRAIKRLERSVK